MNNRSLFLTPEELKKLTGYELPSYQIRKLREFGIRFFEAKNGYPNVLCSDLENKEKQRTTSPNLSALKKSA